MLPRSLTENQREVGVSLAVTLFQPDTLNQAQAKLLTDAEGPFLSDFY